MHAKHVEKLHLLWWLMGDGGLSWTQRWCNPIRVAATSPFVLFLCCFHSTNVCGSLGIQSEATEVLLPSQM